MQTNYLPADKQAQEVLEAQWLDPATPSYPVDPVVIARRLGINVYRVELPAGVSGYIVKRDPASAPDIFVNSEHAPVRQRFTVAHELGHYFKRKGMGPEFNTRYALKRDRLASCGTDDEEIYANQFAAALLMPNDIVVNLADSGLTLIEMARQLRVSLESLEYRLQKLNL